MSHRFKIMSAVFMIISGGLLALNIAAVVYIFVWNDPLLNQLYIYIGSSPLGIRVYLIMCSLCTLFILFEALLISRRLVSGGVFTKQNTLSLRLAAAATFAVAVITALKMINDFTLLTGVLAGAATVAGLFLLILAEGFAQASAIKDENDLTI